jgi:hypothetical protein
MPTTLLKPRPPRAAQVPRPQFWRRFLISAIRFCVVVTIAAVIGGGWYIAEKGFGSKTRQMITDELRKHGVEARIAHLTLDPFRGLVAQDVRIYDYKSRENTLALVSEISLDINYAALLHHQPFLNGIDVRNAQMTLPLPAKDAKQKPQLQHFNAHIYFAPEQIDLSQAEGWFCGIRISATGQLIKRQDYKPSPPLSEEEWQKRLSLLQRLVAELQKIRYPAEHPALQIKFSGDLADMENARVEATLHGERLVRQDYECRSLNATAAYADQRFMLNELRWEDATGDLSARGHWDRRAAQAEFQARSTINLKSLLDAFGLGTVLSDAVFSTSPNLDVSGTAHFVGARPQIKVLGHAAVANFSYHGVSLTDLAADFSWDGERTLVRDLRVRQQGGELKADVLDAPEDFRLNLDSTINPLVIKNFLSPEMQQFLSEWDFQRLPAIHLEIRAPNDKPDSWRGDGTIALERTRFRGALMSSATCKVHFAEGAVTYDNVRVARSEGMASGSFTYDFRHHEVRLSNIKSSLDPDEAIVWVDPTLKKTITPYKFHQPPSLTVNGVYQFAGGKGTHVEVNVDASRGLDYVFLGKTLPFDRVTSRLLFTNDRLQIEDLHGTIFSGDVRGGVDLSLAHNDQHYRADITVAQIDFPRLTDLYWQYKTAQGRLNGSYAFTGIGSDARSLSGSGKIEVTNGDVFAIPVFGPLSGIVSTILPGTGYSIGHKATAGIKVRDGVIHTDNFEVAGKLFSMLGRGDIHFLDDKLNFEMRIDMHGAAGVLLAPVYKFFEYVGEGSLKKPDWHPKRF